MDHFLDFSLDRSALIALAQVILIDITLAGDNAIVIGMTAARVAPEMRKKVIFWGLVAAVVMRIGLALAATRILAVLGLTLAGGILLLWVSWRLYRDIKEAKEEKAGMDAMAAGGKPGVKNGKSQKYVGMTRAIFLITLADLSMSLDNVLAVAGAAMQHLWVLVVGLALSVALMGAAAVFIAKVLKRFQWISYAGLLIVVYVALRMIWEGGGEVFKAMLHHA